MCCPWPSSASEKAALEITLPILAILGGFVALVWGADRFVEGSAATARNLGVSPLVIGLTIVGFGTSAPEMLVSAVAAGSANSGLSVGNAVGSNITNIGLVLGVAALVAPLTVHSKIISRQIPVLLLTMLASFALLLDGELSRLDGAMLLSGLLCLVGWVVAEGVRDRRRAQQDALQDEFAQELTGEMETGRAVFWILLGLAVLLASARLVVWGAASIATWLGVSDLVIGLTLVAFGTSLPELAASIISAVKQEHDIAIGNVIGSNMFNLLGVLALPGLIAPGPVDPQVVRRDYPVMFGITVLFYIAARGLRVKSRLGRLDGAVLLLCFVVYVTGLYLESF